MEQQHCAMCGSRKRKRTMIRRRLNGRTVFCCSIPCEVRWEKENLFGVCG